jgi:hypothetical protein
MKLLIDYKKGTLVTFKWYERWQDAFFNTNNFRVIEGIIEESTMLDGLYNLIVYNGHENKYYAVRSEDIIKVF